MAVRGRVLISELYCKGCELCVHACPQDVLSIAMDQLTSKGYHPARLSAEGCTGCAICALVCPEAAITVYRETLQARTAPAAG